MQGAATHRGPRSVEGGAVKRDLALLYTCGDCGGDCTLVAPGRATQRTVSAVVECSECHARWVIAVEMLRAQIGDAGRKTLTRVPTRRELEAAV